MGTAGGVVLGFGRAHLSCYLDIQTHTHAHTCTLRAVCSLPTVAVWLCERDDIVRNMTSASAHLSLRRCHGNQWHTCQRAGCKHHRVWGRRRDMKPYLLWRGGAYTWCIPQLSAPDGRCPREPAEGREGKKTRHNVETSHIKARLTCALE